MTKKSHILGQNCFSRQNGPHTDKLSYSDDLKHFCGMSKKNPQKSVFLIKMCHIERTVDFLEF